MLLSLINTKYLSNKFQTLLWLLISFICRSCGCDFGTRLPIVILGARRRWSMRYRVMRQAPSDLDMWRNILDQKILIWFVEWHGKLFVATNRRRFKFHTFMLQHVQHCNFWWICTFACYCAKIRNKLFIFLVYYNKLLPSTSNFNSS